MNFSSPFLVFFHFIDLDLVRDGSLDVRRLLHTLAGWWSFAWHGRDLSKLPRWNLKEQRVAQLGCRKSCQRIAERVSGSYFMITVLDTYRLINVLWLQTFSSFPSFAIKNFQDHLWIITSAMNVKNVRPNANTSSLVVVGTDQLTKQMSMKLLALIQRVSSTWAFKSFK